MVDDPTRSDLLLAGKLRALVRGREPDTQFTGGGNSPILSTDAGVTWALVPEPTLAALSRTLARTVRSGARDVQFVVDGPAPFPALVAARLATLAGRPGCWRVHGAELEAVAVPDLAGAAAAAGPLARVEATLTGLGGEAREAVAGLLAALADRLPDVRAGRDRDGLGLGVLGLEVARIVLDDPDRPRLALGVGRFDRDARAELEGGARELVGVPTDHAVEAVAAVVATVRERRRPDAPPHPARTLRASAWLRERVLAEPRLAGLAPGTVLAPVEPPDPPATLDVWSIAPAVGDGVVVASAVGVDPDAVGAGTHAWLQRVGELGAAGRPWPGLVVAVPARDARPILGELVAALRPELGARLVPVPDDWATPARTSRRDDLAPANGCR